jgi:hypothetical protein
MAEIVPSPSPIGTIPPELATQTPREVVQPRAIAASYGELARGMQGLSGGLEALATPIAEAQAASDVQTQRVMLGPDGKIQVTNPARSFIMGPAGEAYAKTVVQSTAAQVGSLVDQQLTNIHQQHLGDPQGQAVANQSFLAGLRGTTGNPIIDNAIANRAGEAASRHYDSNLDFTSRLNLERNARNDSQIVSDREEQLLDLAQNGVGAGNKVFDQAMAERQAALDRLQASPLSKTPDEVVNHKNDQFRRSLEAEATIGGIHNLVENGGGLRAAKDAVDRIRQDPQLDPSTKRRLLTQAQAAVEAETPAYNARLKVNQDAANGLIEGIAKGAKGPDGKLLTPDNWRIHDAFEQSVRLGDLESIKALDAAFVTYQHLKPGEALPDDVRRRVYDLPGKDGSPPPSASAAPAPAAAATPAPIPPKSEWPKGAVYVAHSAAGAPVYVDKDGVALPDAQQPKPAPAVATPAEAPAAQPAAVTTGTSEAAAAVNHGSFISALVKAESNGQNIYSKTDPDVAGPNSRSQGYAQINTPTWQEFAPRAGVDLKQYPNAMSAPYDVQIEVAKQIPISRFGPRTKDILHAQFGQFDDRETVGQVDARFGGKGTRPTPGGPQTATSDTRPYTPEELKNNPYLLSESVGSLSIDKGIKVSTIEALVQGMENASKYIDQLPVESVAAVKQYYDANPDDPKAQELWGKTAGIMAGMAGPLGAGMPAPGKPVSEAAAPGGALAGAPVPSARGSPADFERQVNDYAREHPDILHGWFAKGFQDYEKARAEQKQNAPYDFAAARKIIGQTPEFNPQQPEATGPVLSARIEAGKTIGAAFNEAPPPLLQKNDAPVLNGIINGPDGAKALTSISATASPEALKGLADQEEARSILTQAFHSGDPMKMQGSYSVLDRMYRENPLDFDAKFKGVLEEMTAWKENMTSDPKAAMDLVNRWRSPDWEKTVKPMIEAANKQMADDGTDVNKVTQLFSQGLLSRWASGTSAVQPPAAAGVDQGAPNAELWGDYRKAYEKCFIAGGGPDGAQECAKERILNKWSPSEVNGGRVTAWAPEAYYRNPDGSPSMTSAQMNTQLDDMMRSTLGVPAGIQRGQKGIEPTVFGPDGPSREQMERLNEFNGPRVIVGDDTTRADYVVGKPPSYLVFVQRPSDGSWFPLMNNNGDIQRMRFDPLAAQAETINKANAERAAGPTPPPPALIPPMPQFGFPGLALPANPLPTPQPGTGYPGS